MCVQVIRAIYAVVRVVEYLQLEGDYRGSQFPMPQWQSSAAQARYGYARWFICAAICFRNNGWRFDYAATESAKGLGLT